MLFERMMRAARLDSNVYEEVEADTSATSQAATVVAIVAICQGIASAIGVMRSPEGGAGAAIIGLIVGMLVAFLGWVAWSYITYWIGTSVFKGAATPGEMLRTIGFAQSPQVLLILSFIPILGGLLSLVVGIWSLIAAVIALRQGLDISTGQAVVTGLLGFLAYIIIAAIAAFIFGVGAMATGAIR